MHSPSPRNPCCALVVDHEVVGRPLGKVCPRALGDPKDEKEQPWRKIEAGLEESILAETVT